MRRTGGPPSSHWHGRRGGCGGDAEDEVWFGFGDVRGVRGCERMGNMAWVGVCRTVV